MVKGLLSVAQKQRKKYLEKLKKNKELKKQQSIYLKHLRLRKHNKINWIERRTYRDYDFLFSQFLKGNLLDEIININKNKINKKQKLKIIEDGSGLGLFLVELKKKLNKYNISSELTALSLQNNSILKEAKKHGFIDNFRKGAIETFVPQQYYDIIFSLYGGIHYSLTPLKKEFILKFCYSLNKGGMAFIGLDIKKYLVGNSKRDIRGDVIKFLQKVGFNAEFYKNETRYSSSGYKLPKDILIIKRL